MSTLGSIAVKLGLDPSQFRNGLAVARAQLAAFKSSVNDSDSSTGRFSKTLEKLGESAKTRAAELGKAALSVGSMAGTAATAAPYLVKAGTALYQFGAAAAQASPALLALGAAGEFVRLTMTRISQSVLRSFNPILDVLNAAGDAASAVASKGLAKLSAGFAKVNMPAIRAGMLDIADATNTVVAGTLRWGQSAAGVSAIRALTVSTGLAMQDLAPHITRLVEAFGNMVGRISAVSLAAGSSGLGGALDRLSKLMDRVNAATVSTGLARMKADLLAVWSVIKRVTEIGTAAVGFFTRFRTEISAAADAITIAGLAFGAITGPIGITIAVVGILIRHWDQLKAAYASVVAFFTSTPIGTGFLDSLRAASETIVPALQKAWTAIKAAVGPVLQEIWDKIQTQVLPALSAFIAAVAPVVAMMVNVLGPIVAEVWASIGNIISGAVSVITGIIQVFTAILTGDWRGAWEGIKNIVSGVLQIIGGIISGALAAFAGAISAGLAYIGTIFRGLAGIVLGALGNLAGTFAQVGWDIIRGIGNGLSAGWSWLKNLVSNIASSLFNAAKAALGISSPSKLFETVGANVGAGLIKGLTASQSLVDRAAADLATSVATGYTGAVTIPRMPAVRSVDTAGDRPIQINFTGGTPLENALLQAVRKAVRQNGGTSDAAFATRR